MGQHVDPEIKAQAKMLFCLQRKMPSEVADTLGLSASTMYRWIKEHGWKEMRASRVMSAPFLAHSIEQQMAAIIQKAEDEGRPIDNGETDRLYKLGKMAENLNTRGRFQAHAIETMDLFNTFMSDREPSLAQQLVPHIMAFTTWVVKLPSGS